MSQRGGEVGIGESIALVGSRDATLLSCITESIGLYFHDDGQGRAFSSLLDGLLSLSGSTGGFIAELRRDEGEHLHLAMLSSALGSPDPAQVSVCLEHDVCGDAGELARCAPLLRTCVLRREVVVDELAASDVRSASLHRGRRGPRPLMGIPLVFKQDVVGVIGLFDRPGGYGADLADLLEPLAVTTGQLIDAYRFDAERDAAIGGLRRAQRWSRSILDNLSEAISVHTADGEMIFSNRARTKDRGAKGDTAAGFFGAVHPEDQALVTASFQEIIDGSRGRDDPFEYRMVGEDGAERVMESWGQDLLDDDAVNGVMMVSRNITERRKAEAQLRDSLQVLDTLVSSLEDGVLFLEPDGRVAFVNGALCELVGVEGGPEVLIGRSFDAVREVLLTVAATPLESGSDVVETQRQARNASVDFPLKDGRTVEGDYIPVPTAGDRNAHLWLMRDATAERDAQERRDVLFKIQLEMRGALEEHNRSLIELADLKSEFVASVSHELRTPLTSVVSFAELLMEEAEHLTEEQREFLGVIRRNADRLLVLVGDLLLLAKFESGSYQLDLSTLAVPHLISVVAESLSPLADSAGVALRTSVVPGPQLEADAMRIEQVLSNLVTNAIKYTPPGGSVDIEAKPLDDAWQFTVTDTGIGIPAEEQHNLFERFFRASNTKDLRIPGTGLGLVICKFIVEFHGGTIDVESEVGRGTVVTVSIPIFEGDDVV